MKVTDHHWRHAVPLSRMEWALDARKRRRRSNAITTRLPDLAPGPFLLLKFFCGQSAQASVNTSDNTFIDLKGLHISSPKYVPANFSRNQCKLLNDPLRKSGRFIHRMNLNCVTSDINILDE